MFHIQIEVMTDDSPAYNVMLGETEVYAALDEQDAHTVCDALNEGLARGFARRIDRVVQSARNNGKVRR